MNKKLMPPMKKSILACSLIAASLLSNGSAEAAVISFSETYQTLPTVGTNNVFSMTGDFVIESFNPVYPSVGGGNYLSLPSAQDFKSGTLIYRIAAGGNDFFTGNFDLGMKISSLDVDPNSINETTISYSFDNMNWTTLIQLTNATPTHTFDGTLSFDATGQSTVYVRIYELTQFYGYGNQVAQLDFDAVTVPEPSALALGALGLLVVIGRTRIRRA